MSINSVQEYLVIYIRIKKLTMKKHFKPEDRTLAFQTFFFYKAMNMADIFGKIDDEDRVHINRQWVEFTHMFDSFIKSDFNRDDFSYEDCVIGYLQDLLEDE